MAEYSLRQRLINYRNDWRDTHRNTRSAWRALATVLFEIYADTFRRSKPVLCDFNALTEKDLCDHQDTALIRTVPRRIVRCRHCQVAFTPERDSLTRAIERHDGDYFQANRDFVYPDGKPDLFNYLMPRVLFMWALGFPQFRPENRRVIDVGCGMGIFPKYLEFLGFDAHGVEISDWAVGYAKTQLNLKNVIQGTLQDAQYPDQHFSLVTLVHVLEHLNDPTSTLREIFRVLEPGGYFYVEVPASERDASDYRIDDHFWFYNAGALQRLLCCMGFREVRIGEGTFDPRLHNVPFMFALAQKPLTEA